MILVIVIVFVNSFGIIQPSKYFTNEKYTSYEVDDQALEKLKSSSDMSSPLLWYSKTGYDVQAVAISSDGNYSISGSKTMSKNLIACYHKDSSVPLWVKDDLNGEVFSVDISSNGSYMVAGTGYGFGQDTTVYLFEKDSATPLWSYQLSNIVFSVAISSNGNYIVAGSKNDRLYLFHKSSSTPIWSFLAGDHISSVAISNDGMYIVAGSGDHKIYLFERSSSTPLWSRTIDYISGNMGDVESVSISSDGNYIVAGTQVYQGTSQVYLFQRSSSTPLWKFSAEDYIESVSIDSVGNYIVAGGQSNKINLFQRSSSTPLWSYTAGDTINSVSISADGNYIVSGGSWNDQTIYLFNKTNNVPLWKYKTTNSITSVHISANGGLLVGGGLDENTYLFKSNGSQKHVTLYSDAINPETNSEINLFWNTFINPEHIWIYEHDSFISEINSSVSLVGSGTSLNNPYTISGLLDGTHYYKIRMNSSTHGEMSSNCIKVNIFAMYSLLWARLYGDDDVQGGMGMCVDSSNNLYQTGYIMNGPWGANDGIIIKSSNTGVQLWNVTFGWGSDDIGMDVCTDSANDVCVVGDLGGFFTAKYNSDGIQVWNASWSEISGATGRSIAIDSEDNIYVAGYAGSSGSTNLIFIKYNNQGTKIWERNWGGSNYEGRYGLSIAIDLQDNLCIAAQTNSFGAGDSDAVLIKYDKLGNQLWNTTWGGASIDGARAIAIDSTDNIYIAGYTDTFSTNGYRNLFIVKYTDSGAQIWNKTWVGLSAAYCKDMAIDSNNRILLTGYTLEDMTEYTFLLVYDVDGTVLWDTTWGNSMVMMNQGNGIGIDSFDDVYISGYIDWYYEHRDDIFLLKYSKFINESVITINSPQNSDVFGFNAPLYDITITGENQSIWYTLDAGVTNITITESTGVINQAEWNKLANGIVKLRFYVNLSPGNSSYSEVSIYKDTVAPITTINFPLENELFGKVSPSFNLSVVEINTYSMWYSLDGGSTNITFQELTGTINQFEWDKFGNGTVAITFYAKDEADNENYVQVTVRKEATPPLITINSPNESEFFNTIAPTFNLTVQEPDLDTSWYSLDDGDTNFYFTGLTGSINQTEWDKFGGGNITIKFYVNDSYGFESFAQVTVHKDIGAPIITIISPEQGSVFSSVAPMFEINVLDSQLDSMWYTIDSGLTIIPLLSTVGTIDQTEWNKRSDGNVYIRFYANDTFGNTAYSEVLITKDFFYGIAPIELLTPRDHSNVFSSILNFNWSSIDAGLGSFNFTLQVSNLTNFSHIIFQSINIASTPIYTNFSVPLPITTGQCYWRVRPTYGIFNGSWSNYFSFILSINDYAPNLVLDECSPTTGTRFTIFRFTATYSDLDNNSPSYIRIVLNGTTYSMERVDPLDGDFTDGCVYQFLICLDPSEYAYIFSFECSDGGFYGSTSIFIGPFVEAETPPDGTQGLNDLNSANIFTLSMMIGISIGIIIPVVIFAEVKTKRIKKGGKPSTKIKNKGVKS